MLEDPRKRQKISFVTKRNVYERLVKKNSFIGRRIIDSSAVLVKNRQTKVKFEKPLFIGYVIIIYINLKKKKSFLINSFTYSF